MSLIYRRKEKIECGGEQAYSYGIDEVLKRTPEKVKVISCQTIPHPVYRAHQRRDKHGTDNYSRRVHVQSHRRYHNGKHQDPQVGASELNPFFYFVVNGFVILQLRTKVENCSEFPDLFFHSYAVVFTKLQKKGI